MTGPRRANWQNCVTVLFFGIKLSTTKSKIMQINAACNAAKFILLIYCICIS